MNKKQAKCEITMRGSSQQIRGRVNEPSRLERNFWERFPELARFDPEDSHKELIQELRKVAIAYFAEFSDE